MSFSECYCADFFHYILRLNESSNNDVNISQCSFGNVTTQFFSLSMISECRLSYSNRTNNNENRRTIL